MNLIGEALFFISFAWMNWMKFPFDFFYLFDFRPFCDTTKLILGDQLTLDELLSEKES